MSDTISTAPNSTATPRTSATDGAAARPALRHLAALRLGWARTRIELLEFFRDRSSVVFIFSFPMILLLIFGSAFKDQTLPEGVTYAQYFTSGMLASGIVLSSFQLLAIEIAVERDSGLLKRLRGTPMPPTAYFLGKIGKVLLSSLIQAAILLVCGALLFDLDLPTTPGPWLRFAWIFLLGTVAGTVLGIAFSSVPRSARSASAVVSPVVIILQFISGIYFVYSEMPEWMRQIGALFPLKWLAQGMRSVFLPDGYAASESSGSWELPRTALILGIWSVAGLVLSVRTFRWQRRGEH